MDEDTPFFSLHFSMKGVEIVPPTPQMLQTMHKIKLLQYKAWKIFQNLKLCKRSD